MPANTQWKNPQGSFLGTLPDWTVGTDAVDGDAVPFVNMRPGHKYTLIDSTNETAVTYEKLKADGADDDWSPVGGMLVIKETFGVADMTDATATTGTYVLSGTIPVGAYVQRCVATGLTGFAGDTSATIQVGDGTDVDRYTTGTPDVFSDLAALDLGAVSGTAIHATAVSTITVTITSDSDFSDVITDGSGQVTLKIFCLL
jgi:hypothetical protein